MDGGPHTLGELCVFVFHILCRLYFNPKNIWYKYEYWRLLTNFVYFGNLGIDWLFHMFFMLRYSKSLEEGWFRNRPADFLWMIVLGGTFLSIMALWTRAQFLGPSLSFMLVYIWARRNQYVTMQFMGVLQFKAPWLPWVLMMFGYCLGHSPVNDFLGLAAGHLYYFFEDVYPVMFPRRQRILATPPVIMALMQQAPREAGPRMPPVIVAPGARILGRRD